MRTKTLIPLSLLLSLLAFGAPAISRACPKCDDDKAAKAGAAEAVQVADKAKPAAAAGEMNCPAGCCTEACKGECPAMQDAGKCPHAQAAGEAAEMNCPAGCCKEACKGECPHAKDGGKCPYAEETPAAQPKK